MNIGDFHQDAVNQNQRERQDEDRQKHSYSVKTTRRLAPGIFLGAICGAVLIALFLKLPPARQFAGTYGYEFQTAFGRFFGEHVFPILTGFGAVIGAATGGSLAVSKRWCALLLTFIAGIAIGGDARLEMEREASAPLSPPVCQRPGIGIARALRKSRVPPKKVLALDCDQHHVIIFQGY